MEVVCCMCSGQMVYNPTGMCVNCLTSRADITEGVTKEATIYFCRNCERYCHPPWMKTELESQSMASLCLSKLRGLKKLKLVDVSFVYTEPHSRRIKLKLTVQK